MPGNNVRFLLFVYSVSQAGMTALHSASVVGSLPAVQLLLRNSATVNAHDLAGDTALHYACHCGHTAVVLELLKGGADPAQPALVSFCQSIRVRSNPPNRIARSLLSLPMAIRCVHCTVLYCRTARPRWPLHLRRVTMTQ